MTKLPQERFHDPLSTPDLVKRRWEQRAILRQLHEQALHDAATHGRVAHLTKPSEEQRTAVELELRDEADRLCEELGPLIERLWRRERARALTAFVHDGNFPDELGGFRGVAFGGGDNPFTEIMGRADIRSADDPIEDAEAHYHDLVTLALLLMWADELSPDGYRDPRM